MNKHYKTNSFSISSQSQFTVSCKHCNPDQNYINFVVAIPRHLYVKENNFYGRYRKITQNIIKGFQSKYTIDYKQALIQSIRKPLPTVIYKDYDDITNQISLSILKNTKNHHHYNKMYLGQKTYQLMMKYQQKKKILQSSIQNKKLNYQAKFNIYNRQLSTQSNKNILLNSQIHKKYDFFPISFIQNEKSKLQVSIIEIQKMKRNISIMIEEINIDDSHYPQIKDLRRPYLDFVKSKKQIKWRNMLQNNVSEIHQRKYAKKSNQNLRLYTTPDPMDDDQINENKYAQAYGLLLQNPQFNKRKTKKSFTKLQFSRQKSKNISKTKIINITASSSRQVTQRSNDLILKISQIKSKSKSKLKRLSKNRLLQATSSSRNKIRPDKSQHKSRKLLETKRTFK